MEEAIPEGRPAGADFALDFARASSKLEEAVHELLSTGWDESRRRRAHELASALADAAKSSGWKELGAILRAMDSLLALPLGEAIALRTELREKFLELLELLKDSSASDCA